MVKLQFPHLKEFLMKFKNRILILIGLSFIAGLLDLFALTFLWTVVDSLAASRSSLDDSSLFGWVEGSPGILVIFSLVLVASVLFRAWVQNFCSNESYRIVAAINVELFRIFVSMPLKRIWDSGKAEWIALVSEKIDSVGFQTVFSGIQILVSSIMLFVVSIFLFVFSPSAMGSLVAGIVVLLLVFGVVNKLVRSLGNVVKHEFDQRAALALVGADGFREIRLFGVANRLIKDFHEVAFSLRITQAKLWFLGVFPRYVIELSITLGLIVVVLLSEFGNLRTEDLTAVLGVSVLAGLKFLPIIQNLFSAATQVKAGMPLIADVDKALAIGDLEVGNEKRLDIVDFEEIRLRHIFLGFGSNIVFKDLNLSIVRSERIGIVGDNGSGKSTFINILSGLIEPDKGFVAVDGEIVGKNSTALQDLIAVVPQKVVLFPGSIRENIEFFCDPELKSASKLSRILKTVGLEDLVKEKGGVDIRLTNFGEAFSGGELQKIAFARALYLERPILILDEATSALDGEAESDIVRLVDELGEKKTVIWITHRSAPLAICTKIFDFNNM